MLCTFLLHLVFPLNIHSLRPEVDSGTAVSESLDSAEAVQRFAATLVPLLLEVWVEASASESPWNNTGDSHLLTPDAMSVMFQVLSLLQLLRKLAPQQEHQNALVSEDTTCKQLEISLTLKTSARVSMCLVIL